MEVFIVTKYDYDNSNTSILYVADTLERANNYCLANGWHLNCDNQTSTWGITMDGLVADGADPQGSRSWFI